MKFAFFLKVYKYNIKLIESSNINVCKGHVGFLITSKPFCSKCVSGLVKHWFVTTRDPQIHLMVKLLSLLQ